MAQTDLTYIPDFRHIFEASAILARRRYTWAQQWSTGLIMFGTMVAGGLFAGVAGTMLHKYVLPDLPNWLFPALLLLVLAVFYVRVLQPWLLRRSGDFVNDARPRGPMRFQADDIGLRWTDDDIDFHINWSGVEAIYASASSLCFMSGAIGLVLPLEAFGSKAEAPRFLEDALSRITPDAAAKSRADKSLQNLLRTAAGD